jgi:hypothetical protein
VIINRDRAQFFNDFMRQYKSEKNMRITQLQNENSGIPFTNDYGFVGVQYLAEKYHRSTEEILNLFIDCDYSICQTVEVLEQANQPGFAA